MITSKMREIGSRKGEVINYGVRGWLMPIISHKGDMIFGKSKVRYSLSFIHFTSGISYHHMILLLHSSKQADKEKGENIRKMATS